MEKRKWLWKRKSSERSPGETESSESFSSHSERYSDEQEAPRESPNDSLQSPDITSKAAMTDDEMKESVKSLTEKLSSALVNVSAKEDLVKQHAKVAEEAVAGWEMAENEVVALKQQLEVAVQQNLNLDVRSSHLDSALKECVRQLRQARDEQEKQISDVIMEKSSEWESAKAELEKQIFDLQAEAKAVSAENSASIDPSTLLLVEALEKENSSLKQELISRCRELEIMTIERDLSTQAAETASKLQLESIKKVAKLEAECRRLQSITRKSSPLNNQKSIPEIDQFKNEKPSPKSLAAKIDMMDDFLEMERLVALPETKSITPPSAPQPASEESGLRAELDSMTERVTELENKLGTREAEKLELKNALDKTVGYLKEAQSKMAEAEIRLEELQRELTAVNETKELLEFQLIGMEVEARTMSANIDTLKTEVEEEKKVSAELRVKCQELENELTRTIQETELQQTTNSNGELKIKQEDLAVAADKLAECQKTIASLGRQLQSLATLEDFLIDTSNIPGFSRQEIWSLPSNDMLIPKRDSDCSRITMENYSNLGNGNEDSLPSSLLSASSTNHITTVKSRNSFGKFFSRSKSVIELENSQDYRRDS